MVVDAIRKIFSRGGVGWEQWNGGIEEEITSEPAQIDFGDVITKLTLVQEHFTRMKIEVADRLTELYNEIRGAVERKDYDRAEILAAEYTSLRYLLQGVTAFEKLIGAVVNKIKVVKHVGEVQAMLASIGQTINAVMGHLASISPEYMAQLYAVKDTMETIIKQTSHIAKAMPSNVSLSKIDPEIGGVLSQIKEFKNALQEAAKEVDVIAPKPIIVIDYEELESRLIEYIKAHNGVVRLREAARELGVSPRLVKEVLYRLAQKGVISLTKEGSSSRGSGLEGPLPA